MTSKQIKLIAAGVLLTLGYSLMWYTQGFYASAALFIVGWGMNLERNADRD